MRCALLGAFLVIAVSAAAQTPGGVPSVDVDEHLSETIPLDLRFLDETGQPVLLSELFDRPVVLSLVYYRCPGICSPLMSGLVDVIEKMELEPGVDYRVLTISFDETETPDLAARKKINYMKAFHTPIPEDAWRFMTGDSASIARITEAVGFRYERQGKDFVHPGVITVLSPNGRIARYLHGITFLPFDLKMAVLEASEERWGPTVNRVLLYCFSYDPDGNRYVFNILKVTGTVIMFFACVFVVFLIVTTRRSRKES